MKKIVLVSCLLFLIGVIGGCSKNSYFETTKQDLTEETESLQEEEPSAKGQNYVQIAGAVNRPGVYVLPENARIYQVIEMAQGLAENADDSQINQAKPVEDGEKIYVPTKEEMLQRQQEQDNQQGINLNTATKEQLTSLSGIGEARAEDIIAYREKAGGFSSVEDLMKVPGIKEGVFQKIKDQIRIN